MDKISLKNIFWRYIKTLHSADSDSLYIPDLFFHLGLPLVFCGWTLFDSGNAALARAYFPNAMTAISVISGFMCGLAVMIFELMISLDQNKGELGESAREIELIDELFSDVMWSVVAGFLTVGFMVLSGSKTDTSPLASVFTALAFCLCVNFVVVTLMCLKRIDASYQIASRYWGRGRWR